MNSLEGTTRYYSTMWRQNCGMSQTKKFKAAPAKYKSKVWTNFGFDVDNEKKVICRHCLVDVPYSGGTTNLATHLRRHHPDLEQPQAHKGILHFADNLNKKI